MLPRVKYGLIIGAVGLVLNACVSTALGICGPFTALLAGGVSGLLAAMQEKQPVKAEGAKAGAISGLISGGLVFIGQLIGAVGALLLVNSMGGETIFGQMPDLLGGGPEAFGALAGGLGTGVCFGMVGIGLSALAGALAGYLSTPATQSE